MINHKPTVAVVGLGYFSQFHLAAWSARDDVAFVAGHSLGEYSALCAAGALSLADTARLLRIRGKAMQEAVPVGEGAMAAVLGLDAAAVEEVAEARDLTRFQLDWTPTETGLAVLELEVTPLDNERFLDNNRASLAVDVRKERARLLLLSSYLPR